MSLVPAPLILASSSAYRRALLSRLTTRFESIAPAVDESPLPGELPALLAARLAALKAATVAEQRAGSVVIGSDQVATLDGLLLGKPGTVERACEQLLACSGRTIRFFTAVAVSGPAHPVPATHTDQTDVSFRVLDPAEVRRYVAAEQPLDCAGSFKAEGLGITLFSRIRSEDPTGLQGLPLIWLSGALRELGFTLP